MPNNDVQFYIHGDGTAYFKNKQYLRTPHCKKFKVDTTKRHKGFMYKIQFDETPERLDGFKNFALLVKENGGVLEFVNTNLDAFLSMGDTVVSVDGFEEVNVSSLKANLPFQ